MPAAAEVLVKQSVNLSDHHFPCFKPKLKKSLTINTKDIAMPGPSRDARVYTFTRVHNNELCTRLQNYTLVYMNKAER